MYDNHETDGAFVVGYSTDETFVDHKTDKTVVDC